MDNFARKAAEERLVFINEAASRRDVSAIIIEKDFWVCWTLKRLTEHADLAPYLTFKGGTSLSKAYGIIERFSEDIDLTIGRDAPCVRDTASPMEASISKNEVGRRAEALKLAAQAYVRDVALPAITGVVAAALGTHDGWRVVLDGEDPDAQTILFYYPKLLNYGMGFGRGAFGRGAFGEGEYGYIKPHIKLEFGARGEIDPHELRSLMPYLAQSFPDALPESEIQFSTLAAERTFWEKATILHSLHHGVKLRDRMSRHYYDTYMLTQKGVAESALRDPTLLENVVRNKSLLWRDAKASYDTAKIGSLKILPTDDALPVLKKDYAAMSDMFMGAAPEFDAVMRGMADLEKLING
ncbi:nucleotidyl transferase AbiEii/AbiGii toxin family protein [Asticcacaulis sp. SL142]|uniref:nucleotidyl transferase AbiEii/AbiGii toxin family protein n=1 Tax=Asticcacaulis sp. SL142 TaxID=2995155 RepID=UPI00226C85F1|nr:nucleotidyl transferase AbiEii/AbiGii toxin family protein [Asticcacaulis sp. SL142]WAC47572.1 nucleotidyl transferase AbiEii/AbiGii toxin family protein [Asticcacaulis sp. SL142]